VPLLLVTHYVTLFFFDTAGRAESQDNVLPTENQAVGLRLSCGLRSANDLDC
jgi:hypothetical protein